MINKKKAQDVQFFTEVVESVINMEGTRRSAYDPDEIEEEQREREVKKRLNALFKDFCQKVRHGGRIGLGVDEPSLTNLDPSRTVL